MKDCQSGKHKYLFNLPGWEKNKYGGPIIPLHTDFACLKCGLNWNFDTTLRILGKKLNRYTLKSNRTIK